jgi:hypothetical protein
MSTFLPLLGIFLVWNDCTFVAIECTQVFAIIPKQENWTREPSFAWQRNDGTLWPSTQLAYAPPHTKEATSGAYLDVGYENLAGTCGTAAKEAVGGDDPGPTTAESLLDK